MKTTFTKIERTAGYFIIFAVAGCIFAVTVVAVKQGWFEARDEYITKFEHAEGIHSGTPVQISGLKAGSVEDVRLTEDNRIEVRLEVGRSFAKRIKNDSVARVIRPFIIGDKVIDISVGSPSASLLADKKNLNSEETMDIMDMLGGGKIGPFMKTFEKLGDNLKLLAEGFADPERSKVLLSMFDEMLPTLKVVQTLGKQLTKKQAVGRAVENLANLTDEMNVMIPEMRGLAQKMPAFGENTMKTMEEVAKLTAELNKFVPVLTEIAPHIPKATDRGVEALEEAVITLKAMQKSFLLSGKVEDVKKERAEAEKQKSKNKEKERMPANEGQ